MDVWFVFIGLSIPVVMIIFGALWRLWPPKNINRIYGYRSKRSMASLAAWTMAHVLLGKAWLVLGLIMLAVTAVFMVALPVDEEMFYLAASIVQIVVMFVPVPFIERRLREEFDTKKSGAQQD